MNAMKAGLLAICLALVSACGGGSQGNEPSATSSSQTIPQNETVTQPPVAPKPAPKTFPVTRAEAARFLTQATFGPTDAAIDQVMALGYEDWIDQQINMAPGQSHVQFWDARDAAAKQLSSTANARNHELTHSFWAHAMTAPDQLRQRVSFALSEIFVISWQDSCIEDRSRASASYLDMLNNQGFGSYRNLLEQVARHPSMGCYLSHLKNQRENTATGRVPDENFAREVMQLFSIGLYQLNLDGSNKYKSNDNAKQPIETYGASDIAGLAKVFTGLSYDCPVWPSNSCFWNGSDNTASPTFYADRYLLPMRGYAQFHSYSEKSFLGVTIAAQVTSNGTSTSTPKPDPDASLSVAFDTLASHPNVGPFIGKQLIQRLVTSNPSPEYIERVSKVFNASNGNLGATVKAILLDSDARDQTALQSPTFGKVREPILRLSALLRAIGTTSDSGAYLIDPTDDAGTALAQSPLKSPSVFNFFRPGYVPPGGNVASAGLVAPEMQLVNENSAAGYINYMRDVIRYGAGRQGQDYKAARRDVQFNFTKAGPNGTPSLYDLAKTSDAGPLIDRLNQALMYGRMPGDLRADIKQAVESIAFKAKDSEGKAVPTDTEIKNRLWSAVLLTVASPEFQVQQ